jgi:hypothetical protein
MHLVVVHGWQQEEAEVAKTIAGTLGTVSFEARQKISGGGPAVIATFAAQLQAEELAGRLTQGGVPTLLVDTEAVRRRKPPFFVRRFVMEPKTLRLESLTGERCDINYDTIDLLLVAICNSGPTQTAGMETKRKFSLGKTLLAGGVPMTRQVKSETTFNFEERDETLWLYAHENSTIIFDRTAMIYDGLGDAMQFTNDLNFSHLKNELRRLAPLAHYDDRMLKRAALVRLIGPTLNPETDHDLAFEVLARSLKEEPG